MDHEGPRTETDQARGRADQQHRGRAAALAWPQGGHGGRWAKVRDGFAEARTDEDGAHLRGDLGQDRAGTAKGLELSARHRRTLQAQGLSWREIPGLLNGPA